MMKAGGHRCRLPFRTREEDEEKGERALNQAVVKSISVDAAVTAVWQELDGIFNSKRRTKNSTGGFFFSVEKTFCFLCFFSLLYYRPALARVESNSAAHRSSPRGGDTCLMLPPRSDEKVCCYVAQPVVKTTRCSALNVTDRKFVQSLSKFCFWMDLPFPAISTRATTGWICKMNRRYLEREVNFEGEQESQKIK